MSTQLMNTKKYYHKNRYAYFVLGFLLFAGIITNLSSIFWNWQLDSLGNLIWQIFQVIAETFLCVLFFSVPLSSYLFFSEKGIIIRGPLFKLNIAWDQIEYFSEEKSFGMLILRTPLAINRWQRDFSIPKEIGN